MVYAAIRVRGRVNVNPNIRKTLELLNLTRVNHCVLIDETPSMKGMLNTAKDYITWGEIDKETLEKLIEERGRLIGDKRITDDYIKNATPYDSISKLCEAIIEYKFKYKEIPEVKPVFRLNPPKKGYGSIKRPFKNKGALGYRSKEINEIIRRML